MKYLLDTNNLSNRLIDSAIKREDLCVLEEIIAEYAFSDIDEQKITRAGIKILNLRRNHLEKMKEIMSVHGGNLKLIRLYKSEGAGDIAMLAYVLAERDTPDNLFSEEYTLVTKDKELCRVAKEYGISCLNDL